MMKNKNKGFTLVELLIVMAIIAILVATILMMGGGATGTATASQLISDLRSAKSAVAVVSLTSDGKIALAKAKNDLWINQGYTTIALAKAGADPDGSGLGQLLGANLGGANNAAKYIYKTEMTGGTPDLVKYWYIGKFGRGTDVYEAIKGMKDILPNIYIKKVTDNTDINIDNDVGTAVVETGSANELNISDANEGFAIFMRVK